MDIAGGGGSPGRSSRTGACCCCCCCLERKGDGARAQRGLAPAVRDGGREVLRRSRLGTVLEGFERDGELSRGGRGKREREEEVDGGGGDEDD